MSDIEKAINDLVEQRLLAALSIVRSGATLAVEARQLRAVKPAKPIKAKPAAKTSKGRLPRRAPEEIDAAADAILAFVRQNPGARSEQIRASLEINKREWMKPLSAAFDKGLVKRGEKRATEYFVGDVPEGAAASPKAKEVAKKVRARKAKKAKRGKKNPTTAEVFGGEHVNGAAPGMIATPSDEPAGEGVAEA